MHNDEVEGIRFQKEWPTKDVLLQGSSSLFMFLHVDFLSQDLSRLYTLCGLSLLLYNLYLLVFRPCT